MSLCSDCKRRDDCCDRDKLDMTEGCGDYKAPAPDPRDRELAVLRAQVRVLVRWSCCPRAAGVKVPCDVEYHSCYNCTEKASRQQAEKEVQP